MRLGLIHLRYNLLCGKVIRNAVFLLHHRPHGAKRLICVLLNEKWYYGLPLRGGKSSVWLWTAWALLSLFLKHLFNKHFLSKRHHFGLSPRVVPKKSALEKEGCFLIKHPSEDGSINATSGKPQYCIEPYPVTLFLVDQKWSNTGNFSLKLKQNPGYSIHRGQFIALKMFDSWLVWWLSLCVNWARPWYPN